MTSQRQLALLVLTLTLGVQPVFAQQAQTGDAEPTVQAPAAKTESGATPQQQGSSAAGEPDPASEPASTSKDSPFDYRSSEEISEDLSVSFPVDI